MKTNLTLIASVTCLLATISPARGQSDYITTVEHTPNLLGYWRFSPASQANSEVNGYTGTFVGDAVVGPANSGPSIPGDLSNSAVLLDGTGDYVSTSLQGVIDQQGSIVGWFYLTALPSTIGHAFSIAAEAQPGNDFDFQIETDNVIRFFTDSGSHTDAPMALTAADLNKWHFVAATFSANSSRRIYLDGVLVATSVPGGHSLGNGTFTIGENAVFTGRFFDGRLDEIAVFNRKLSATEVGNIYASSALRLKAASSRKTHGASGVFSLPLVLSPVGNGTVESRAKGPTKIVFTFNTNLVAADGTISANEFTIGNANFSSAAISGNRLTLNLTGVTDQSVVSVTLNGINDLDNRPLTGDADLEIRALLGDASQDRTVNMRDLRQVRQHAGEVLDQMSGNFIFDLDLDGTIGTGDSQVVRMNLGHTVP